MLSIVICTRNVSSLERVSENIKSTVGIPCEIIGIDNSKAQYGICEAYNIGASQARFDFLCFMHEDIHIHVSGWGTIVTDILSEYSIGVLGVAGGTYQVRAPASWNSPGDRYIKMNVLHTVNNRSTLDRIGPDAGGLFEVAAVDGLWMCCRKNVWSEFKFDEIAFPGFHFYDVDFCTRVFTKYKICVTLDILIEHFSYGSYNKAWYDNAVQYYDKRKAYLPFGKAILEDSENHSLMLGIFQSFISGYIDHGIGIKQAIRLLIKCFLISPFDRDSMWLVKKYIKVSLLNKKI